MPQASSGFSVQTSMQIWKIYNRLNSLKWGTCFSSAVISKQLHFKHLCNRMEGLRQPN